MRTLLKKENVELIVDSNKYKTKDLLKQYILYKRSERKKQSYRRAGISYNKSLPLFIRSYVLNFLFVFKKESKKDSVKFLNFNIYSSSFLYNFSFRKHSFNIVSSFMDIAAHSEFIDREEKFFLQNFDFSNQFRHTVNINEEVEHTELSKLNAKIKKAKMRKSYQLYFFGNQIPFWILRKRRKKYFISAMAREALEVLRIFSPLWDTRIITACSKFLNINPNNINFKYLPKQYNNLSSLYFKMFMTLFIPFKGSRRISGFIPFLCRLRKKYADVMHFFFDKYRQNKNQYYYRIRKLSTMRHQKHAYKKRLQRESLVHYRTFHKFRSKSLARIERSHRVVRFFKKAKSLYLLLQNTPVSFLPFYPVLRIRERLPIKKKILFNLKKQLNQFEVRRRIFNKIARSNLVKFLVHSPFLGEKRRLRFNFALVIQKANLFSLQNKNKILNIQKVFKYISNDRLSHATGIFLYMLKFPKQFNLIPLNLHKLFLSSLQYKFKPIQRSIYPNFTRKRFRRLRFRFKPVRLVYLPYRHKFHGFQAHILDHKNNNLYSTWPGVVIKRISKVVGYNQAHKFMFLRTMKPKKAKKNWMAKRLTVRDASNFLFKYIRRNYVPTIEVIIRTTSPLSVRMGELCLTPVSVHENQEINSWDEELRDKPWYFFVIRHWKNNTKNIIKKHWRILKLMSYFIKKLVRFRRFVVRSFIILTKRKFSVFSVLKVIKAIRKFLILAKVSIQYLLVTRLVQARHLLWRIRRYRRRRFMKKMVYSKGSGLYKHKYKPYIPRWYKDKQGYKYIRRISPWVYPKKSYTATSRITSISKITIHPCRSHGLPNKLRKSRRL